MPGLDQMMYTKIKLTDKPSKKKTHFDKYDIKKAELKVSKSAMRASSFLDQTLGLEGGETHLDFLTQNRPVKLASWAKKAVIYFDH